MARLKIKISKYASRPLRIEPLSPESLTRWLRNPRSSNEFVTVFGYFPRIKYLFDDGEGRIVYYLGLYNGVWHIHIYSMESVEQSPK